MQSQLDDATLPEPDLNFTATISKMMNVPHHIRVAEGADDEYHTVAKTEEFYPSKSTTMNVPDRILVAGGEQHFGVRAPPREIALDMQTFPAAQANPVVLETPPRSLKLTQRNLPDVDDELGWQRQDAKDQKLDTTDDEFFHVEMPSAHSITGGQVASRTPLTPSEELRLLRKHVTRLSTRLYTLEQDVQFMGQRDRVMIGIGVVYFVIKFLSWIRHSA